MLAIEIESLSKTFYKRRGASVHAVSDLSLAIHPGQVFGFLGPNGAGKTTTIKMACGLVTPTAGKVRLNGFDVARQRGPAMSQIGVVLEGTRNVYWRLSAWRNMLYFGRLKGYRGKKLKQRSEWLLRELDLWDRRNDEIRELSRGTQQKVAIACALVADPPIVLLDEPTLGLDVQAARTVKGWIKRLTSEQGKTVLLTTHQLDLAQEVCDRVAIIDEGSLVADRPVVELLSLSRKDYYSIRVRGLTDGRLDRFTGLEIAEVEGDTVLSGTFEDQQELHQVLRGVQELGLTLVSVEQTQNNLEDVFVRLIEGGA